MATSIMNVMKMGNIAPRVGIKLASLAFRASVLTTTAPRLPDASMLPTPDNIRATALRNQYRLERSFINQRYLSVNIVKC